MGIEEVVVVLEDPMIEGEIRWLSSCDIEEEDLEELREPRVIVPVCLPFIGHLEEGLHHHVMSNEPLDLLASSVRTLETLEGLSCEISRDRCMFVEAYPNVGRSVT
jgi:hypothetical protein